MSKLILVRALWKIWRKTPPNLLPTSRTPETNVAFTTRGVRIVRKRYAPRSRHDFAVKAKTNVCRVELRWTDQRRVAAPDRARPALRVRQQRTLCIRTQSSGPQQCDRCRSLEKYCVGQTPGLRKKRQAKPS